MKQIDQNKAILKLPKTVEHNFILKIHIIEAQLQFLIIDFQYTTKVTLSGIMYLICLSGYLKQINKNSNFFCEIINIKEYILNFIMNFGFLQQMTTNGNLYKVNGIDILIDKYLLEKEKKFINHQLEKRNSDNEEKRLIMPISIIVTGEKRYYESYVRNFRNRFYDYYMRLIELDYFLLPLNSEEEIKKDFSNFTKAISEVDKNIYDHSHSWGISAIHAREKGIEIVYYDIGIGIANSMKVCPEFSHKSNFDAINIAFEDGKSSKSENGDNKGRGFTKMMNFTREKKGYLSVRTDCYHFTNGKPKNVKWFPGTQIVIFIPN